MIEVQSRSLLRGSDSECLTRRGVVPFYKLKGMIHNVWFTDVPTPYFRKKLTLQDSQSACIVRLKCLKEPDDMLALRRLPRA
jgi:hypothetical protein